MIILRLLRTLIVAPFVFAAFSLLPFRWTFQVCLCALQKDFEHKFKYLFYKKSIRMIQEACEESLDPETYEKWIDVKKVLKNTRYSFND